MKNMSRRDSLQRQREADAAEGLMNYSQLYDYRECLAEREAESAWLRYAESRGWEEEYFESLVRSGLRVA